MRNRSHHTEQPPWRHRKPRRALPLTAEQAAERTVSNWLNEAVPTPPEGLPDQPDGSGVTPLLDAALFPGTPKPERPKRSKPSAVSPEFLIRTDPRQLAFIEADEVLLVPGGGPWAS